MMSKIQPTVAVSSSSSATRQKQQKFINRPTYSSRNHDVHSVAGLLTSNHANMLQPRMPDMVRPQHPASPAVGTLPWEWLGCLFLVVGKCVEHDQTDGDGHKLTHETTTHLWSSAENYCCWKMGVLPLVACGEPSTTPSSELLPQQLCSMEPTQDLLQQIVHSVCWLSG